jgi:ADP-ribose pyrophosphatase YjhB (NUDIX family)
MTHYQNPKIVCGAIPLWENKVLLCRRAIEPRVGKWNLPAGYMENKETLKEAALREVWEEANARIEIKKLHTVFNIRHVNQVYFLFLAQLIEPEFSNGIETLETRLFGFDEIPWEDLAFPSNIFALKQYIQNPIAQEVHHADNLSFRKGLR